MTILLDRPTTATKPARRLPGLFRPDPTPPPPVLPEKTTRSFRELVDQLNALNTAGDVADLMRREGATGVRDMATQCVIAEWMRTNLGGNRHLRVRTSGAIQLGMTPARTNIDNWSPAVSQFIRAFDRGAYPDLARR